MAEAQDVLFLGRGPMFPLALEGALKLKEISYIHAESYAASELKHGPLALISPQTPTVFILPDDDLAFFDDDDAGAAFRCLDGSTIVTIVGHDLEFQPSRLGNQILDALKVSLMAC